MGEPVRVTGIWQEDARTLGLSWTSGRTTLHDVVALRRRCPCAVCTEQPGGPDVDDDVRPVQVTSVGTYALSIAFDDGHDTGIYTFDALHDRLVDTRR